MSGNEPEFSRELSRPRLAPLLLLWLGILTMKNNSTNSAFSVVKTNHYLITRGLLYSLHTNQSMCRHIVPVEVVLQIFGAQFIELVTIGRSLV